MRTIFEGKLLHRRFIEDNPTGYLSDFLISVSEHYRNPRASFFTPAEQLGVESQKSSPADFILALLNRLSQCYEDGQGFLPRNFKISAKCIADIATVVLDPSFTDGFDEKRVLEIIKANNIRIRNSQPGFDAEKLLEPWSDKSS